jgi:hypothetical protein
MLTSRGKFYGDLLISKEDSHELLFVETLEHPRSRRSSLLPRCRASHHGGDVSKGLYKGDAFP